MAVRLPLVLSQPARREATAVELIENIVAAALLLPKLDANLVGDISSIEPGGTDHLCLQGHTRDLILASFLDLEQAQVHWLRLGQGGQFIDCQQSSALIRQAASQADQRRVFYFQLKTNLRIATLLDQCQELVSAQAVQLVSIQLGSGTTPRSSSGNNNSGSSNSLPIVSKPSIPKPNNVGMPSGLPLASPAAPSTTPASPMVHNSSSRAQPAHVDDDEDWSSIDKLVDELDAMDI